MTNKFLPLSLLFFLLLSNIFAQSVDKSNYALLWEVTGKDLMQPSYLFGTMHVKDERVFEFSDSVLLKLDACEAFANEVHPDSLIFYYWDLMYHADTTNILRKMLSENAYERLDATLADKLGKSLDSLHAKDPNLIDILLDDRTAPEKIHNRKYNLDTYLYKLAKQQGKSIFGVESPEDHYLYAENILIDRFEGMVQEDTFDVSHIFDFNPSKAWLDSMRRWGWDQFVQTYQSGDLAQIKEFTIHSPQFSELQKASLFGRNKIMAKRFLSIAEKQSLFCAVGAAHLPDDEGIIALLKRKGYKVRAVNATFTGLADRYVEKKVESPWYQLLPEVGDYTLNLPAEPFQIEAREFKYRIMSSRYLYADILSRLTYYIHTHYMPNIGSSLNIDQLCKDIFLIHASDLGEILQEDTINVGEFEGRSYLVQKQDSSKIKIWIIPAKNQAYTFRVRFDEENAEHEDIDRFFSSISIAPSQTTNWYQFKHEKGAFGIQFPSEPQYQKLEIPYLLEDESEAILVNHLWVSNDLESGDVYMMRYNDCALGAVYDNDSLFFAEHLAELVADKSFKIEKQETIYINGYEGRDVHVTRNELKFRVRFLLRGQRTYFFMQQLPIENDEANYNEEFFNSFTFADFQPPLLEKRTFEDQGFSAALSGKVVVEHDTLYNYSFPETQTHSHYAVEEQSGTTFYISRTTLSPYYEAENIDSFYRNYLYIDSTLIENHPIQIDTVLDGKRARYQMFDLRASTTDLHYLLLLHKQSAYDVYAYLPKELSGTDYFWNFIQHFRVANDFGTGDIFSSKKEKLFQDLQSNDSLTFYTAKNALSYYPFEEDDISDIQRMLQIDLALDTASYSSVFGDFCELLEEYPSDSTFQFLLHLFKEKSAKPGQQLDILASIQSMKHPDAFKTTFDLLPEIKRDSNTYFPIWKLMSPFRDSFALYQAYFPELLELSKDSLFESHVLSHISGYIYRDSLELDFLLPEKAYFFERTKALAKQHQIFETDSLSYFEGYWKLSYLVDILLANEPTDEMRPFIRKLSRLASSDLGAPAISYLLRAGEKIDKKTFQKLAKDTITWLNSLYYFDQRGQLDRVPKKLYDQSYVAEAHLRSYMEEDYYYGKISQVKLLETITKSYQGKAYRLYIYRFNTSDDANNYFGFVAQPKDPKTYDFYEAPFNFSEEYEEGRPLEEQLEKLFEYYEFE
ncbi:MAG: TraB/GumN family protein [Bacteroidota bacterium]